MDSNKILVAVYGTLRKGQPNHILLDRDPVDDTWLEGWGMKDLGFFPMAVPDQERATKIEIYAIDEGTLASLDRLEGCSGPIAGEGDLFRRTYLPTPVGKAWLYHGKPGGKGRDVLAGDWVAHRRGSHGY